MENTVSQVLGDLMIESSIDAMVAIGTDDVLIAWNETATALFHSPKHAVLGKQITDALPSLKNDAAIHVAIKKAKQGLKSFLTASGEFAHRKHMETHVIPLRNENAVVGVMLLIHDVSHRIAKEVELQRLNRELKSRLRQLHLRTDELTQLTSITGHNVRKPIREIYLAVEHLIRSEAAVMSSKGRASFRRIQSSLTRISLLLDDIITLNQIDTAEEPSDLVNLDELLTDMKNQFAQKLQHSNTVLTVGQLGKIVAHRNQLHLLIHQLFSNIIKFAESGSPTIHMTCVLKKQATAQDQEEREFCVLILEHNSNAFDNISPNVSMQVNEEMDIRQYTGPAIAMLIANRIMEVHTGFVDITQESDGRRQISCYFPVLSNSA